MSGAEIVWRKHVQSACAAMFECACSKFGQDKLVSNKPGMYHNGMVLSAAFLELAPK